GDSITAVRRCEGATDSEAPALTPVDHHRRAADPAGSGRRKKRHDVCHLLRGAETAKWQLVSDELGDRVGILLLALPPRAAFEEDRPRGDAVPPDVRGRPALGER